MLLIKTNSRTRTRLDFDILSLRAKPNKYRVCVCLASNLNPQVRSSDVTSNVVTSRVRIIVICVEEAATVLLLL